MTLFEVFGQNNYDNNVQEIVLWAKTPLFNGSLRLRKSGEAALHTET